MSDAIISPSGKFSVYAEISGDEAGPTRRYCVRLKMMEMASKKEFDYQTGASSTQKWAMDWSSKNILILYSSDIGVLAYEIKENGIEERPAVGAEMDVGRNAYEKKYGKRPKL